jgi:hypothetical protein
MAFISVKEVKEKRERLKKELPTIKMSVTCRHHSSIDVHIISAPFDMMPDKEKKYEQVNQYYISDHYKNSPQVRDVLLQIYKIISEGKKTISEDGDYGSIPNFYCNIAIGKWDKPFVVKM